jgi:hypothetical protein
MPFHFDRASRRLGAGVVVMLWLLVPASAASQSGVVGRFEFCILHCRLRFSTAC